MRETDQLKEARRLLQRLPGGEQALAIVEEAWDEECRGAGLYPDTLFHFTDKRGLLGILKSNFKITYSLERIEFLPRKARTRPDQADTDSLPINRTFGAPMVSFCDLRLSELRVHMRDYGSYGIGMSKDWAIENGLNPVYYINSRAELLEQFITSMAYLFSVIDGPDGMSVTYHRMLNFYRYMKNYEAPLFRKGIEIRSRHRFANEREWRYVPPIDDDLAPFVTAETMSDPGKKRTMNARFSEQPLRFEPKHINYVIVRSDDERNEIIHYIENVKEKYDYEEVLRLKSRILTSEQIHKDV